MSDRVRTALAVGGWAGLVAAAAVWGSLRDVNIGAPPLAGEVDPSITPLFAIPVAVAALLVWLGPRTAGRLGWRGLLAASGAAAAAWAVALALAGGADAVADPLTHGFDYLSSLDLVRGPHDLLGGFVDRLGTYTVHVRGHPPGFLLLLWGLDRAGLGGPLPAAVLVIAAGASAVPATLVAVREVADERAARTLAPLLVLAPAAVWVATSADAFFLGLGAWGTALVVLATGRTGTRARALALGGGLLLGAGLMCSYGIVPLGAVPLVVAVARRRLDVLLLTGAGALAVLGLFGALGFWWPAGLRATAAEYAEGVASVRPYAYFVVANLAAFSLATGPAAVAGLARLRDRRLWLLVGGGLLAVLAADLSGLSKGEVERIWLPFVPWVLASGASLGSIRAWAAAGAVTALGVQALVATPW